MTYVDIVTTIGIWTFSNNDNATTSVNITTDFMLPGKLGSELLIEAKIDKLGKRLAFSSAYIYDKDSMNMLAKGNHTKAFLPIPFKNME